MIKPEGEEKVVAIGAPRVSDAPLPFAVELWTPGAGEPERVIGRAASLFLARAVFAAAVTEHAGRRVVLRRGSRLIDESR